MKFQNNGIKINEEVTIEDNKIIHRHRKLVGNKFTDAVDCYPATFGGLVKAVLDGHTNLVSVVDTNGDKIWSTFDIDEDAKVYAYYMYDKPDYYDLYERNNYLITDGRDGVYRINIYECEFTVCRMNKYRVDNLLTVGDILTMRVSCDDGTYDTEFYRVFEVKKFNFWVENLIAVANYYPSNTINVRGCEFIHNNSEWDIAVSNKCGINDYDGRWYMRVKAQEAVDRALGLYDDDDEEVEIK